MNNNKWGVWIFICHDINHLDLDQIRKSWIYQNTFWPNWEDFSSVVTAARHISPSFGSRYLSKHHPCFNLGLVFSRQELCPVQVTVLCVFHKDACKHYNNVVIKLNYYYWLIEHWTVLYNTFSEFLAANWLLYHHSLSWSTLWDFVFIKHFYIIHPFFFCSRNKYWNKPVDLHTRKATSVFTVW